MLCMDLMDICSMFFFILLASISTNLHNSEHLTIKIFYYPVFPTFSKIRLKTQPGFTRVNPVGKPGERWALRTLHTIYVAKTKAQISWAGTVQLIFAFVCVYAKSTAHI